MSAFRFSNLLGVGILVLSASAANAATPTMREQMEALACNSAKESCCEQWVKLAREEAVNQKQAGRESIVDAHRIDRWRSAENRPYCAIRTDILGREKRAAATSGRFGAEVGKLSSTGSEAKLR